MANRELVVAVFADGEQFQKWMTTTGPESAKVFSYEYSKEAQKRVASMMVEQTKLRGLAAEYKMMADSAVKGSALATAAATRLAEANRKLGVSTITAGQAFASFSNKAAALGRSMSMYITVPVAIAAAAATKMFIDFQKNMELIHTQAGATQAEVNKLSPQVLNLAQTSAPQGPNELSQGLFHLESLGLRGANAMKALKISSDAAGLGIADLESVATALGGAVVTNIKGTHNYTQAMATLNATIGAGNMRMNDLTSALSTGVLPAAKDMGLTLPEVGAALAVLTDRGMGAQMAATRLRMTFSMMEAPTKAATDALANLGITSTQLAKLMRSGPDGFLSALELIQAGVDRMKDKVRATQDVLNAFGRGRSGAGILTLLGSLNSGVSSYQGKLALIQSQTGQWASQVEAYHKTAAYQISHAWASVQASLIQLGAVLAPAAIAIAKAISGMVLQFRQLPGPMKDAIGVAVLLFAGLGPVFLIAGRIGQSFIQLGVIVKSLARIFTGAAATEVTAEASVTTAAEATNAAVGEKAVAAAAEGAAGVEASMATETASIETAGAAATTLYTTLGAIAALGVITVVLDTITRNEITNGVTPVGPLSAPTIAGLQGIRENEKPYKGDYGYPSKKVYYDPKTKQWYHYGYTKGNFVQDDYKISSNDAARAFGISQSRLKNDLKSGSLPWGPNATYPPDLTNHPGNQGSGVLRDYGKVKAAWINAASHNAGVSAAAIQAIISQESGGTWQVNRDSGATGFGQIMPSTGRGMKYNYLDPKGNVMDVGILLAGAVKKYGSYEKAFASFYGGGWGAKVYGTAAGDVRQGKGGKYPSVNEYVQQVMAKMAATGAPIPIDSTNNPMAGQLGASVDTEAQKAAKKAAAAAKRAADAAAKAFIKPIETMITALKTNVNADIKSGNENAAMADTRKLISGYKNSLLNLINERRGKSKEEQSKLDDEISKLKNGLKLASAELIAEYDKKHLAVAKGLAVTDTSQFSSFSKDLSALNKAASFKIPGVTTDYISQLNDSLTKEADILKGQIAVVKGKLVSATGKTKTALDNLLTKLQADQQTVTDAFEQGLETKVNDMQNAYQTALSNFDAAFSAAAENVKTVFENQTQDYINNVIAPKYYQQKGQLTPAEQQLKDLQDVTKDTSLQKAIRDATLQLINDISQGSDLTTILNDNDAIKAAKDAITQDELQVKATQERNDADNSYAAAVRAYTNDRQQREEELSRSMSALLKSIDEGTGSFSDFTGIITKYGVTVDGIDKLIYQDAVAAFSGKGGLVGATTGLQNAFIALINWINKTTGTHITVTTTSGNGTDDGSGDGSGDGTATRPGARFGAPVPMASGAYVRGGRGGVIAHIGEGVYDEIVMPLTGGMGSLAGGVTEVHVHVGTVIGTSLEKAGRELAPHVRTAIQRNQRRNGQVLTV